MGRDEKTKKTDKASKEGKIRNVKDT